VVSEKQKISCGNLVASISFLIGILYNGTKSNIIVQNRYLVIMKRGVSMSKTIYIADDEHNIRELISGFLKSDGY
jgi:DUF2075 family protein